MVKKRTLPYIRNLIQSFRYCLLEIDVYNFAFILRSEMRKGTKLAKNQTRDGKQKDESKNKRELKTDRPLPKQALNQSGPVSTQTSLF